MAHTHTAKKTLLTRVRRISGQLGALEKALEDESECSAVLQQIAAIRGAVGGLMSEVLEGHVRDHLSNDGLTRQQRTEDMESVLAAMRSYMK